MSDNVIIALLSLVGTILGELNKGQRKKLLNNPTVAALLKRYGIAVDE